MKPQMRWEDKRKGTGYETAEYLAKRYNRDNWRGHPELQRLATEEGLDTINWVGAIKLNTLPDGSGSQAVIDGHLRIEIALAVDPDQHVPVDYYELTQQEQDYALAHLDTLTGEAVTLPHKLSELMERTKEMSQGEGMKEVREKMMERVREAVEAERKKEPLEDGPPPIDKAEELNKVWGVEVGQVWSIGPHRLACGDCTDRGVVERVMGGGKAVSLLLTDIPYDVAQGGRHDSYSLDMTKAPEFEDFDKDFDPLPFLTFWYNLIPKSANWFVYVGVMFQGVKVHQFLDTRTDICSSWVWVKKFAVHNVRGVGFAKAYEMAIYAWNKGHYFDPLFGVDGYDYGFFASNEGGKSDGHPTSKPLALFVRHIKQLSKEGDLIFDPFAGSGTTGIAAHQTGRRSALIEIEPKYCAVVLERFKNIGVIGKRAE